MTYIFKTGTIPPMSSANQPQTYDFLIIGSGAAGLLAARRLAEHGSVAIVSKSDFPDSNTYMAQGGIAGVTAENDSVALHIADTVRAGSDLCHIDVVDEIISQGSDMVRELVDLGAPFDTEAGKLHLTREGGHSKRRVAHARDATGRAIGEALLGDIDNHANITCLHHHSAIDVITARRLGHFGGADRCLGAYLLTPEHTVIAIPAASTILATGGAGKAYMYTSNPHGSTGDGIAMAWRAGCPVMNMEFMQFHPTCLYHPQAQTLLLSEALRGEGALLVDASGQRFMDRYDDRGELASRDIVARAIDHEMKKQGVDCMYLDARNLGRKKITAHFPNIQHQLLQFGLDINSAKIPIVPAAHYTCGGVKTDTSGRTSIKQLYAIGETACTGLHGANRLACNSLLECLVMADLCSQAVIEEPVKKEHFQLPAWDASGVIPEHERIQIKQNWDEIRSTMSNYVGIVRSDERLRRARRRLSLIHEEIASYYWKHPVSLDLIELRNLALVAELIVRSAQQRQESRGLHFSTDYPNVSKCAVDTILTPQMQ
ncbi:MAG: L-aspartate oxidase [Mariprofundaceae bacterium]